MLDVNRNLAAWKVSKTFILLLALFGFFAVVSHADADQTLVAASKSKIKVSPKSYNFGKVLVGETRTAEITITNVGEELLFFTMSWSSQNREIRLQMQDTGWLIVDLEPQASITFHFDFTPSAAQDYKAVYRLNSYDYYDSYDDEDEWQVDIPFSGKGVLERRPGCGYFY